MIANLVRWAIVAAAALAAAPGVSQDAIGAPGTPKRPVRDYLFAGPPTGLTPLQDLNPEGVNAARSAFANWVKARRAELGPYENEQRSFERMEAWTKGGKRGPMPVLHNRLIPNLLGYFMLVDDPNHLFSAGTIFAVQWSDNGEREELVQLIAAEGSCVAKGKAAKTAYSPEHFVYLGPRWRPEWSALSSTLASGPRPKTIPVAADPTYLAIPTAADIDKAYPKRALKKEVAGHGSLLCTIGTDGRLGCTTLSETPVNWGFGKASINVSRRYVIAPTLRDGTAAAGKCMIMPIGFKIAYR